MSKMRLHILAKELGIKSPELIAISEKIGMERLSNFSNIDEEQAETLRKAFRNHHMSKAPQQKEPKEELIKEKSEVKSMEKTQEITQEKSQERLKEDKSFNHLEKVAESRTDGKKKKKKSVYVFDNKGQSGSYSSDQGHAYIPRQNRPKRNEPQVKVYVEEQKTISEPAPKSNETAEERRVTTSSQPAPAQREQIQKDPNRELQRDQNRPRDGKNPKQPRAIIGTISTADYSRPMPMGRPSSTVGQPRRPMPEGRRPAAPGRPGMGAQRRADAGKKAEDFAQRKPAPAWKKKETNFVVEEEIQKTTGKRKSQKKKDAPVDKDRLEKKSKTTNKKKNIDFTGDFDFAKKRKQKSLKYKALQNKEKSERLDELLQKETVYIPEEITVKEFAEKINKNSSEIIMKLVKIGKMLTINNYIDYETAALIAMDYEIEIDLEVDEVEDYAGEFELDYEDDPEDQVERAPVVTVMGHVDHGKTSLLDAIRNTGVASGEAGGITQHIGASEVIKNDKKILFLDTPGHEAFSTLRARGAQITDIAVLVVAADDGVMPQTIEAIDHSKAAGVPIIVAINKIDKPTANPDRVKQELSERGLIIEEWGGDVIAVPVSAKSGEGIDRLLDMILIVAEVQDLKSNPNRPAVGTVIDAKVVKGRGVVTTVLIEKGTLHQGDNFVAGRTYGRIKTMLGNRAIKVKTVGPSSCVEIDGISDIPNAGEKFYVTPDEKTAKLVAEKYDIDYRRRTLKSNAVRLEQLFDKIKDGSMKELCIIIKADVQGSVEALKTSLVKLSNEEVRVNVIRADVGTISESDVILASASNALIIGFNVRPINNVAALAESEGVDIRTYNIIYKALDDVENALKGMLDPIYKEVVIGNVEVRSIFKIPGGVIAGSYVTNGKITRNAGVRVVREGIVLYTGKISSLRRFKDDVREVAQGYECGIGIDKYNDLKEGDELEAFIMEEIAR